MVTKKCGVDTVVKGNSVSRFVSFFTEDTSGPALNIVMKLMAVLSLVFADTFYAINNGGGLLGLK